jgi:hypothetical protein
MRKKAHELTRYDERDMRVIMASGHFDANESMFFARQLEYIRPQAIQIKRAALSALDILPVSTEIPAGAKTHTYRMWDGVAMAKIIANYADDLPRAMVFGTEFTGKIRGIGISYGYSFEDIRAAQMAGANLATDEQTMAKRGHDELLNQIALFGDVQFGLPGFLTNANIPLYVLPADGTGASKTFLSKTADQIIRDLNAFVNGVRTTTKNVHKVNALWLPLAQYTYISTTRANLTTDGSILQVFQKNQPGITVLPVLELAGSGAGATDRMACGEFSPENCRVEIPMSFQQHAPQLQNMEYQIPCESRTGGTVVPFPLAFQFADGL